jgi:transcriptional regulator with XRE-family HTH domain
MPLNAQIVEQRRRAMNLSMAEAGRQAGFSHPSHTWYRLETGRRSDISADTLARIAMVLNLPATDLLTPSPTAAPPADTPTP